MIKKFVILSLVFCMMFTLAAFPKFTMLDYDCGNTPEYTAKFVELVMNKKVDQEYSKYICSLRSGTWIVDFEDGQKVYASLYKGNIIAWGYVKEVKNEIK